MTRATKPKGPRASAGAKPVRPKKLIERPWPWMILAGLLGGGIVAAALSLLRGAQEDDGDAGTAFLLLVGTGVIGVALMLTVAFYSARKRRKRLQEHMPGSMMAWLKAHVWLGLLAGLAIAVHWWLYPVNSRITTGKITLAILAVVVVSGIAWRIVYYIVPRRIPAAVGNLSVKDTRARLEQIQIEIEKTLAGASDDLRRLADELLGGKAKLAGLDERAAVLAVQEQAAWQELNALAERRQRYRGREPKQERYHRVLQGWKVLHLPLAAVLGAAIAIHVWDVLGIGNRVFAEEAQAFPDSAQCADCHSEIVREWMLAVHSVAQTSPTTIAQTALALQQDPEIGQLCTNCHAPIGVQLASSPTFPLPGQEGGEAILGEGVTCWTCHSVSQIPGELRGGQDDFPVGRAGARGFGTVFGPPLGGDPPLPVPDHQTAQGFMTDEFTTFQLCGSCHNVKADIDGDGFSPFGDEEADESGTDTDGDGKLDENELVEVDEDGDGIADPVDVDGTGLIADLVLQTTFDEWEDFIASEAFNGETCATCHMLSSTGPAVDDAPGNLDLPDRTLHSHSFVGVDYDLEPGHYAGLGVGGGDATQEVLDLRQGLISSGVSIRAEVRQQDVSRDFLLAEVTVRSGFIGHDFPTGFAFARQWWLEVSATTENGTPVCLTSVEPGAGVIGSNAGIDSPCSSGTIEEPAEDLKPCDPIEVADRFDTVLNATVRIVTPNPLDDCDPWLANFQKILTDGDPDGDGEFVEVPFQSLQPDIVKNQVRVADQQAMGALKPYDDKFNTRGVDDRERTFVYAFDVSEARGQEVTVNVVMHLRHLPPYFLRALDGFYPGGLTGQILLRQMVVSDIQGASSEPIRVPG